MGIDLKGFLNGGERSAKINFSPDYTNEEYLGEKLFSRPAEVSGEVFNKADVTRLSLELKVFTEKPCDRCGKPTEKSFIFKVERVLVRELEGEEHDDILVVEDDKLDLAEFCLTEIYLSLPLKYLCSENCKGVCTMCGTNLNEGDCNCAKKAVDPRLAALAALLENGSDLSD